jgi:predicted acyl esterase
MVPMRDGVKLATDIYRPADIYRPPDLTGALPELLPTPVRKSIAHDASAVKLNVRQRSSESNGPTLGSKLPVGVE